MNQNDILKNRIINEKIFKSIFINNTNILEKLISDITKIPYSKLKNNILILSNDIPITNKQEKDFIVKINTKSNIIIDTTKYKGLNTTNSSYSINIYSNNKKTTDFLIIQININTFSYKYSKYIDIFELRNNKGIKYINNFKIYTLDIVKCYKIYYHNHITNNNIVKWGTFLYSKINKHNITNILSNTLKQKELQELIIKLENLKQ